MKNFSIIHASELEEILRGGSALLIDIRDRSEYNEGHWPGAVNYPLEEIEEGRILLPGYRLLVLYCDHGGGSMQLARELGQEGYKTATVVGGYEAMKKIK